jgi:hypothetical protein
MRRPYLFARAGGYADHKCCLREVKLKNVSRSDTVANDVNLVFLKCDLVPQKQGALERLRESHPLLDDPPAQCYRSLFDSARGYSLIRFTFVVRSHLDNHLPVESTQEIGELVCCEAAEVARSSNAIRLTVVRLQARRTWHRLCERWNEKSGKSTTQP